MPKYQGELDGLCGPYAIANALEHCGLDSFEEAFQCACKALAPGRWPKILWDGTSLRDMILMIKRCKEQIPDMDRIAIKYPFNRNTPSTNAEYWKKFDNLFESSETTRCAIIGLTRPSDHWIVASHDGGRINFTDSTAGLPSVRKNRSSLHAGERNKNANTWIIDRKELILFEVTA